MWCVVGWGGGIQPSKDEQALINVSRFLKRVIESRICAVDNGELLLSC